MGITCCPVSIHTLGCVYRECADSEIYKRSSPLTLVFAVRKDKRVPELLRIHREIHDLKVKPFKC